MFELNLFGKELRICLGYEFQNINFLMLLICLLNATLILHIVLGRCNQAFIHPVFMGHGIWL